MHSIHNKFSSILLYISVFWGGFFIMSIELLGGKLLSPYFGNSIFVWGSIISVFMLSLSIGYLKGGERSQQQPSLRELGKIIITSALCTLPIALLETIVLQWLSKNIPDPRYGSLAGTLLLFSLPTALAGMISPYAIRLDIKHLESSGKSAGFLYFISTFGSAAGTVFTSFYAVVWFEIPHIILSLCMVSLIIGSALMLLYAPVQETAQQKKRQLKLLAGILLLFSAALLFELPAEKTVLHIEKSMYEDIMVADNNSIRCIYPRSVTLQHSCIDLKAPGKLVHPYTQWILGSLFLNPAPKRILIVGLGAGVLPNAFHRLYPDTKIDIVEIDPAMLNVAKHFFRFNETAPNFHLSIEDGRQFIQKAKLLGIHYDLVILDAFNQHYIPEHMLTKEFLNEVKSILSPEGVLAANTFSRSKLVPYESATYQHVFGLYYNVIRRYEGNRVIIASLKPLPDKKELSISAFLLRDKFKFLGIDPQSLLLLFQLSPVLEGSPVLTDHYSPSNILNASD